MPRSNRTLCTGSETKALRPISAPGSNPDRVLGVCATCGRVGDVLASGFTRIHSVRGDNTRSHDNLMEGIYLRNGGTLET